jgi:ArsR family transcriptional regulator
MDAAQFHKIAKALADPRRFEIYETIAAGDGEMCCGSISECFPVSQATVSHHLKELTEAGLIEARSAGQFKYFRTCRDVLAAYIEELNRRINATALVGQKRQRPATKGRRYSHGKRAG